MKEATVKGKRNCVIPQDNIFLRILTVGKNSETRDDPCTCVKLT